MLYCDWFVNCIDIIWSMDVWWPEHIIKIDFLYLTFLAIESEADVFNLTDNSCDDKVSKKQLDGPNS